MYEAYGNIVLSTGSSDNNRLANTKERDFSIGLDNHGFRYFDPEVGRYVSRDPIGYGDGPNVYLYVQCNPINHFDPLGLGNDDKTVSLQEALEDENLTVGETLRLRLSHAEKRAIIDSQNVYKWRTPESLTHEERMESDKRYSGMSADAADQFYAGDLNLATAKRILLLRSPQLQQFTKELYKFTRASNPIHFVSEVGFSVGSGEEPVLRQNVDRWEQSKQLILYLGVLKGFQMLGAQVSKLHPDNLAASGTAQEGTSGLTWKDDLAQFRGELGTPKAGAEGSGTIARLDVGGKEFYGINAHGQPTSLTVNPISRTHAETDAFQQAANAGMSGGRGRLFVDRDLCGACGRSGAVKSMARQLGLKVLEVHSPSGKFVFRLDSNAPGTSGGR